tara:strand:- start:191 stop:352 length:162 start_codon:yes stop_codon:yes gene_type:complete
MSLPTSTELLELESAELLLLLEFESTDELLDMELAELLEKMLDQDVLELDDLP